MARTRKGSKAPGWDYWGKRPFSGSSPTKLLKILTHHIERRQGKRSVEKELRDI